MSDLLDRIQRELEERLQASRAAVEEYERLQAAMAALEDSAGESEQAPSSNEAAPPKAPRRAPRKRAARGQNTERVLSAVRDRPGVTAPELAAVAGVRGGTLYTVLRRLVASGTLTKRDLPGGDTGYRLNEEAETAA
jgi:sugar-specific transcriptional regulator TrmB